MNLFKYLYRRYQDEAGGDGDAGGGSGDSGQSGGSLLDSLDDEDKGGIDEGGTGEGGQGGDGDTGWLIAEGVPGQGDRPEWFKSDKYKSVTDQAKAYTDLEKKFGGFTGAPEGDYELSLPAGVQGELDKNDPLLGWFTKQAKELNMSQEAFNTLLHGFVSLENAGNDTTRADEMKQLGANAKNRVTDLRDWGMGNLPKDVFEDFKDMVINARAVNVLEHIIRANKSTKQPNDGEHVNTGGVTAEQVRQMRFATNENGERLMSVDPEYRRKVERLAKQVHGV